MFLKDFQLFSEGLIESVMDGMGQHADGGNMDYGQY